MKLAPLASPAALPAWLCVALLLSGCGLFGGQPAAPEDPFADGVLRAAAALAPTGSPSQVLAQIAADQGWESDLAQNTLFRLAIEQRDFERRVEPFLLGLYYGKGYSVLPTVGQGHQFTRDTIVRGGVGAVDLLVTTRDPVRIIFLRPVGNVQIIFPQDGTQPQIFSASTEGVVAVRRSQVEQYLR